METPIAEWPIQNKPMKNARVILASQGIRIWTAECRLEEFGETLRLTCSDETTFENLLRQQRVAFTILDNEPAATIQGNGIVQPDGLDEKILIIEPYRISSGGDAFELRLKGWIKLEKTPAPDTSKWRFWYKAFRLVTLPISVLPVFIGGVAAFALGQFHWLNFLLALIGTVSAHAGANAIADYFDFKKGVDRSRALSSHLGALAREQVEPEMILFASFACFLVTIIAGLILLQLAGWLLLLFGLAGLLGAFFYTGRPFSYKYRALGETMLGLLLGPVVVMGSYFVQTRGWDWGIFLISIALGMIVSSVSLVNNLRDLPDDKLAGIRTLPMSLGIANTKRLYYFLSAAPYFVAASSLLFHLIFWPIILALGSLPQARIAIRALSHTSNDIEDIRLNSLKNPYPLYSIRFHTRFGILLMTGLFVAGVLGLL